MGSSVTVIRTFLNKHFMRKKTSYFHGGIDPPDMKYLTNKLPIRRIPLPELFSIPLLQHFGSPGVLKVKVGQLVGKGEALTVAIAQNSLPVHAPTSGTISAICPYHYTDYNRDIKSTLCIQLQPDHLNNWCALPSIKDYRQQSGDYLIQRVRSCGIAGLGGGGFPADKKWNALKKPVRLVIINAMECEPYITADECLIQEYAKDIIQGCEILNHILSPQQIIIAIEENKLQAITALQDVLEGDLQENTTVQLRQFPPRYPSGDAGQLIWLVTGQQIPHGKHATDLGILVNNVATVLAVKRAIINGEPLIERVVTVTGDQLATLGNYWVPIGTPIRHVLLECGVKEQNNINIVIGGPFMGIPALDLSTVIIKTTNCLLILKKQKNIATVTAEQPCIRCGRCADVCPVGLLPQQLYWYSQNKNLQSMMCTYNLFSCIECAACNYVCPSNIPLVDHYKKAKLLLREQEKELLKKQQAKNRSMAKKQRSEKNKSMKNNYCNDSEQRLPCHSCLNIPKTLRETNEQNSIQSRPRSDLMHAHDVPEKTDINIIDNPLKEVADAIARVKARKNKKFPQVD